MNFNAQKYILVFFITASIFAAAFWLSTIFYDKRLEEIRTLENRVSLNFLALEVESDLISELSCEENYASLVTEDLDALGERIAYLESKDTEKETITSLKTQYSLLELKDYLFLKQLKARCGESLHFVFYFYSNEGDCADCDRQGYVLEEMREKYPNLRVYSFDYNLDIPGVNTLKRFYSIERNLPALVINKVVSYGFKTEEELLLLMPGVDAENNHNDNNDTPER